jgi:hypothetical protein
VTDLVAALVRGDERFAIDCVGDLRVGGRGALEQPFDLHVRHPLTGEVAHTLQITAGVVRDDGEIELVGWPKPRVVVRCSRQAPAA